MFRRAVPRKLATLRQATPARQSMSCSRCACRPSRIAEPETGELRFVTKEPGITVFGTMSLDAMQPGENVYRAGDARRAQLAAAYRLSPPDRPFRGPGPSSALGGRSSSFTGSRRRKRHAEFHGHAAHANEQQGVVRVVRARSLGRFRARALTRAHHGSEQHGRRPTTVCSRRRPRYRSLADTSAALALYNQARAALRRANTLAPVCPPRDLGAVGGVLCEEKGETARATTWYRKAATRRPKTTWFIFLGCALAKEGKFLRSRSEPISAQSSLAGAVAKRATTTSG